jgi:hypothetical protein
LFLALLAEADFVDERVAVVHDRHTVVPVPHIELDTPTRKDNCRQLSSGPPCGFGLGISTRLRAVLRLGAAVAAAGAALPTALQVTARLAMRCDAVRLERMAIVLR